MNGKSKVSTLYLYSASVFLISLSVLTLISKSIGIIQALALFLVMLAVLIVVTLMVIAIYVINEARKTGKKKIHIQV